MAQIIQQELWNGTGTETGARPMRRHRTRVLYLFIENACDELNDNLNIE